MTLEQAKDKAAYNLYSKLFDEIQNTDAIDHRLRAMELAAELYARSKWYEAIDEQRLNLSRLFAAAGGTLSAHYTMKELRKPEFK